MGIGQVIWVIRNVLGNNRVLKTQYYVSSVRIHLFSPQYYFKEKSIGSLQVDHEFAKHPSMMVQN